jgi:hypothetical protein
MWVRKTGSPACTMVLAACASYFNGKPTAAINDKAFARLFFGIWLSPKTSAPGLRNALIGKA